MTCSFFRQLVAACRDQPETVVVTRGALRDAEVDLRLYGREAVVSFIGGGGLTDPQQLVTSQYKNMQVVEKGAVAYSYRCSMGNFVVYLAAAHLSSRAVYCIKSLKWHEEEHSKYLAWQKRRLPGEFYKGIP